MDFTDFTGPLLLTEFLLICVSFPRHPHGDQQNMSPGAQVPVPGTLLHWPSAGLLRCRNAVQDCRDGGLWGLQRAHVPPWTWLRRRPSYRSALPLLNTNQSYTILSRHHFLTPYMYPTPSRYTNRETRLPPRQTAARTFNSTCQHDSGPQSMVYISFHRPPFCFNNQPSIVFTV